MILKRLYDEGLAQASYLVGSEQTDEALVIDPLRDIEPYLAAAEAESLRITHVTETHIHADFLSGARELASLAGARLLLSGEGGSEWQYRLGPSERAELLRDGDAFTVGEIRVDVRHMPGHTPEHLLFLITDTATADKPVGAFTGDFLFVGDVGRPDLLERAAHIEGTMESSARALYQSLRLMREYPDYLQLWPGHGAGSACGKALGALPSTTLGYERLFNWALQISDEEVFVRAVLAGQPEPPRYFGRMKTLNRDGVPQRPKHFPPRLDVDAFPAAVGRDDTIVIDARSPAVYSLGFIPGTINIPAGRSFATWAGSLLSPERDLILIAGSEQGARALIRELWLIGLDRVIGWAGEDIIDRWRADRHPLDRIERIDSRVLAETDDATIIDVRAATEWNDGHIPGARHIFLGDLLESLDDLPRHRTLVVACQGGSRSAIAASLLRSHGFTNVVNFSGGFAEWQQAGLPIETSPPVVTTR